MLCRKTATKVNTFCKAATHRATRTSSSRCTGLALVQLTNQILIVFYMKIFDPVWLHLKG